jgi:hypothetical protein
MSPEAAGYLSIGISLLSVAVSVGFTVLNIRAHRRFWGS